MTIDWSQVKTAEAKAAEAAEQALEAAKASRARAYAAEADPLFFKAQRGEAELTDWQAKVAEIRERFPYPKGATLIRARNADGTFAADDPDTPENEAWVEVPIDEADGTAASR